MLSIRLISLFTVFVFMSACSTEPTDNESSSDVPKPIEIIPGDEGNAGNEGENVVNGQASRGRRFPILECTPDSEALIDLRSEPNKDGTVYFDPSGVSVFGLEAKAIELIDAVDAWGYATYFSEKRNEVIEAIRTTHPEFDENRMFRGNAGIYGKGNLYGGNRYMAIGPATGGLTRFDCRYPFD